MARLDEMVNYCDALLEIGRFQDYCPNGLQVEGRREIGCLVSGVTASLELIDAALEADADAVLVHHGYFWKGEDATITGLKRRRLQRLLQADVSLLAYHLPLDAHPQYGNNIQLANELGIRPLEAYLAEAGKGGLVMRGELQAPLSVADFAAHLAQRLNRQPLVIEAGDQSVRSVAWCTGAAQGYLPQAAAFGVDAYISGEVSEQTYHLARELGVHYFAAGHHATERYGVRALGEHLAERFGIKHRFIDLPNPV